MSQKVVFSTAPMTASIKQGMAECLGPAAHYCDTLSIVRLLVDGFFNGPVLGTGHWDIVKTFEAYGYIPEEKAEDIVLTANNHLVAMLYRVFPNGFADGVWAYEFTAYGDLIVERHEPSPLSREQLFELEVQQLREDAENGGYIPPKLRALIGG